MRDAHLPKHLRLARMQSRDQMRVSWSLLSLDKGAGSRVEWGLTSGAYSSYMTGTASTYTKSDLCGPPATTHGWITAPIFYSAVLTALPTPGTRVFYRVGSESSGFSDERSFVSPMGADANAVLRVTAIADMGESYIDGAQYHWMEPYAINTTSFALYKWEEADWEGGHIALALNTASREKTMSGKEGAPQGRVMSQLARRAAESNGTDTPDVVLHIGDLSYATGYASEWDRFMTMIEPLSSRSPYMVNQGNHERDYPKSGSYFQGMDSGGECGVPTQMRFPMPTPSHRQDEGWYSFEQGPVHFVMLDTEMLTGNGSAQFAFIDADLRAVNRSRTPWVIVSGHRPMYSGSDSLGKGGKMDGVDTGNGPWMEELEDLLYKHEVDLCLWGHVHNAEVTCPVRKGECVKPSSPGGYAAPVHAILGNGGQSLSPFCLNATCCCSMEEGSCPAACKALPKWSQWRLDRFGFSTLLVEGKEKLTVDFFVDCIGERDKATMKGPCIGSNQLAHTLVLNAVDRA